MQACVVLVCMLLAGTLVAQTPGPAVASGSAERGKILYDKTYRCYTCHGTRGETGARLPTAPRLVPVRRGQDGFVAYLRKPSSPLMPSFAHVPGQDLVDVYAYLRAIRPDAPALESIPFLRDVLQRRK